MVMVSRSAFFLNRESRVLWIRRHMLTIILYEPWNQTHEDLTIDFRNDEPI